jgi:hypothetical protein
MKLQNFAYLSLVAILLTGCSRDHSTPAETVATITKALNDRDSATFINSMSRTVRERFTRNPAGLTSILDTVRGSQVTSEVFSVDTSGPIANVVFSVHVRGKMKRDAERVNSQFYFEDGEWKMGPIFSVNGYPFGGRY